MESMLSRKLSPLLLGSVFTVGLCLPSNVSAEELRIGFVAPTTGIFAQVGKDMVDGFQLYLDEHGNKIQVESYLAHSSVPGDPAYSHRVANMAFRLDGDYLRAPNVDVDLTDGRVLFPDRTIMLTR